MRARLFTALLLAGCYAPHYGAAPPFTCNDGQCPSGYHCFASGSSADDNLQALCIHDGDADPPLLIATAGIDSAPPQPVWDSNGFSVFFEQNDDDSTQPRGIYRINTTRPLAAELFVAADANEGNANESFSVIYQPDQARFVLALSANGESSASLSLYSRAGGQSAPTLSYRRDEPASVLGFTAPSLATRSDGLVTLAYTFGLPPSYGGDPNAVMADNAYCVILDPSQQVGQWDSPLLDTSCTPSAALQTQGAFVSSVLLSDLDGSGNSSRYSLTNVLWGSANVVYLTTIIYGGATPVQRGPFAYQGLNRVDRIVGTERGFAMVVEDVPDGPQRWQLRLGVAVQPGEPGGTPTDALVTLPATQAVPDVVSHAGQFTLCTVDDSGELRLSTYSSPDLTPVGASVRVPRLSHAEVESCRLAIDPDSGALGVAWRERLPPSTGRTYFTRMPTGS